MQSLMQQYLRWNHVAVWLAFKAQITSVALPKPHERLDWLDVSAFLDKLADRMASELGDFTALFKLDDALYPTTIEKTIGPFLPTTKVWSIEVGMAVAQALHIAIVGSLKRLGPRYVQVADSKGLSGPDKVQYNELVSSTPIDRYVGVALCWPQSVSVKAIDDPKRAKAAKGQPVGLKKVKFVHLGDNLWNWVRVDSPSDATAEDVAAALFEDKTSTENASSAAYLLAAAPPYFGVPKKLALTNPDFKRHAPDNVSTQDDSVEGQLVMFASTGRAADEASLHQQSTPARKPSDAPAELGKVLAALSDCENQLTFAKDQLSTWGLGKEVAGADAFLKRKDSEVATLDQKHLAEWAPVINGMKDRLSRIAGGINSVITGANKLGIKDPSSASATPLREILALFASAAGTAHLAQTSDAKFLQAMQQQNVLTLRALQATERNMMGGLEQVRGDYTNREGDRGKNIRAMGAQSDPLQQKSHELQTKLANGEQVDPDELEDVSMKSEEVALDSRLYATIMALEDLNKAAKEAGSGDAGIIASIGHGEFRDLPHATRRMHEDANRIRNNLVGPYGRARDDEKLLGAGTSAQKKQNRDQLRQVLAEGQGYYQKLVVDRKLNEFLSHASELIKDQQFRAAIVKVAAMIGITLVAGGVAGLAARAVGGVLLEAAGVSAVEDLGIVARTAIGAAKGAVQIGVDTTISSAGQVAVNGGDFGDTWKENLIVALGTSAVFGSINRWAAEQAQIEGRVALKWAEAGKLAKAGMVVKELGAITAHTIWGAAMGEVAGRIVTGMATPPPETMRDWALQGVSVAVGKHLSHLVMTKSKMYAQLEQSADKFGRGITQVAGKLRALADRVVSTKNADLTLELIDEHDKFMRRELDAIDEAIRKKGDPTGELGAQRDRIAAAAEVAGSLGILETKFTLIGMEELIPGALWKGAPEHIQRALAQAQEHGVEAKVLQHAELHQSWRLKIGEREIAIQEVVSTEKTVNADRILLAGSDEDLRMAAKLVPPKPGSIDIIVHGGVDDFMVTIDGVDFQISHRSLANYIKSKGIKFDSVRLLACKAGMHPKGVAQQLANKLGVTVEAPTDLLWIHPDGTLTIGPTADRNTGKFEPFKPQPSESRSQLSKAPEGPMVPVHDDEPTSTRSKRDDEHSTSTNSNPTAAKELAALPADKWVKRVREELTPDERKKLTEMKGKHTDAELKARYKTLDAAVAAVRKAMVPATVGPGKVGKYTTTIKWGVDTTIQVRPEPPGFWGTRREVENAKANKYELVLNANDEAYFLPHPDGGYVQFEYAEGSKVYDGKAVTDTNNSMYRKIDELSFLRKKSVDQARRQIDAASANGMTVEWKVSDRIVEQKFRAVFAAEGIAITITFKANR